MKHLPILFSLFAYGVTLSALASTLLDPCVHFVKRVSAHAAGLCGVSCCNGIAARGVDVAEDRLEMGRVQAVSDSAKMIDDSNAWQSPYKYFVANSVDMLRLVALHPKTSVTFFVKMACKQPAWTPIKSNGWINAYLAENPSKKFSIGWKFVRVIGEHLSLRNRFDGLGVSWSLTGPRSPFILARSTVF